MRAYQRLNELIENHKGLLVVAGLTALIANYQPANAAGGGAATAVISTPKGQQSQNIALPGGNIGVINNQNVYFSYGDSGLGNLKDGTPVAIPEYKNPETQAAQEEQRRRRKQTQNISPPEYDSLIRQATVLRINNKPLQERIDTFEKALAYTPQLNDIENAKIRYSLGVLYHDINNPEKSISKFEESLKYNSPLNERAKEWLSSMKK